MLPDLAPRKDGVFDYTARLVEGLEKEGCKCLVLVINASTDGGPENTFNENSRIVVLNRNQAWKDRINNFRKQLNYFNPDYLSLQYYYHGYKDKRWAIPFHTSIRRMSGRYRFNVMLHDIWFEGLASGNMIKRVKSFAKWMQIIYFLKHSKPESVLTSNTLYKNALGRWGIKSEIRPIFSPFNSAEFEPELFYGIFRKFYPNLDRATRGQFLLAGIFGRIWDDWNYVKQVDYLVCEANRVHKTPVVVSLGNLNQGENVWCDMKEKWGTNVIFVKIGEQSAYVLSRILKGFDCAITPTPYLVRQKSSSVAAWAQANVPILFSDRLMPKENEITPNGDIYKETIEWYLEQ